MTSFFSSLFAPLAFWFLTLLGMKNKNEERKKKTTTWNGFRHWKCVSHMFCTSMGPNRCCAMKMCNVHGKILIKLWMFLGGGELQHQIKTGKRKIKTELLAKEKKNLFLIYIFFSVQRTRVYYVNKKNGVRYESLLVDRLCFCCSLCLFFIFSNILSIYCMAIRYAPLFWDNLNIEWEIIVWFATRNCGLFSPLSAPRCATFRYTVDYETVLIITKSVHNLIVGLDSLSVDRFAETGIQAQCVQAAHESKSEWKHHTTAKHTSNRIHTRKTAYWLRQM